MKLLYYLKHLIINHFSTLYEVSSRRYMEPKQKISYMDDMFDDEDEFDKILRSSQNRDDLDKMQLDDAEYQVGIIKEYGLRMWFQASHFTTLEEAVTILNWSRSILERYEMYEDCTLMRDSIKWLNVANEENQSLLKTKSKRPW